MEQEDLLDLIEQADARVLALQVALTAVCSVLRRDQRLADTLRAEFEVQASTHQLVDMLNMEPQSGTSQMFRVMLAEIRGDVLGER